MTDFNRMLEDGYVSARKHPTLPLVIYNYTEKTTFARYWNPITNLCRGLIVSDTGEIIARPFAKFHNINTDWMPETTIEQLPASDPLITKKMDGSLGIFWDYRGVWGIATRGSFTSEQADWATDKLASMFGVGRGMWWPDGYTPLFEIIYGANRIVVDYDFDNLVLIGMVNNDTGREMNYYSVCGWGSLNNVRVVEQLNEKLSYALNQNIPNEEGYVATWDMGELPTVKVKIKFADYVAMHRVVTGWNPKTVWEMISTGKGNYLAELVANPKYPLNFRQWLSGWEAKLTNRHAELKAQAQRMYSVARWALGTLDHTSSEYQSKRKQYAAFFFKTCSNNGLRGILFAMLDDRDYNTELWKLVKPRGDDKSFIVEGQ